MSADTETEKSELQCKQEKKEKALSKVIIRRLPPSMTQEEFLNQVAPIPDYDYIYTIEGNYAMGEHAFARVYVNFAQPDDIYVFKEKFDNYVFVDAKGHEYTAVVEYAPFQKVPKRRRQRKDPKVGTLESDPAYIDFLESLKEQPNQEEKPEYSYNLNQLSGENKQDISTPLLDYLKQRKVEKLRLREEKREERKRKEHERKKLRDEDKKKKLDEKKQKNAGQKEAKKDAKEKDITIKKKKEDPSKKVHKEETQTANVQQPETPPEKASTSNVDKAQSTPEKTPTVQGADKPDKSSNKARNKFDERKQQKQKFKFDERKEFKNRREEFRERDREYAKHAEEKKPDAKPEQQKKVKKYSERREERKIVEASKEEAKRMEASKCEPKEAKKPTTPNEASAQKSDDEGDGKGNKNKENDPRMQRRIRNKDRPTMQLYKPGMLRKKSIDNDKDPGVCPEKGDNKETGDDE